MTSYDLFMDEIEVRNLHNQKKEEDIEEPPFFNISKRDWIIYLVISLGTILCKWLDERFASNFAKQNGMERHVFMKVRIINIVSNSTMLCFPFKLTELFG